MLLVALSLRMCCSLVCKASRYTSLPAASLKYNKDIYEIKPFNKETFQLHCLRPCFFRQDCYVSPGDTDHSAGHHPDQVFFHSEEGSVRPAVAERNSKPLGAAQCDVNTELSRRTQHAESQEVCGTAGQGLDEEGYMKLNHGAMFSHKNICRNFLSPLLCVHGPRGQWSPPPCRQCLDTGRARRSHPSHWSPSHEAASEPFWPQCSCNRTVKAKGTLL